jgi:hypothetical protein
VAQDPGLEREKDVDIVFVGLYPQGENRAEDVATALEEVLPKEYPQAWHRPNYNSSNVRRVIESLRKNQIATVTTKPLSVAQKLLNTFQTYGIKCQINAPGLEEDITRRGFLQGAGAAAVAGTAGGAMAAPFRHGEYKDQMTGANQGKYSTIKSDNSNATLQIQWPGTKQPGFILDIPGEVLQLGIDGASGRIKINGKLENIYFNRMVDHGAYSSAGVLSDNIARKLLKSNGEVLIEIPVYGKGNKVYKFTVEPDSIVNQLNNPQPIKPQPIKPEVKKASPQDTDSTSLRQSNLDKMRSWEPEQKQTNSASGQSISRESIEHSMAEGTAGLPDPNNFDSDNDYRDALDAYGKPQAMDADYENMIREPDDWFDESKEKVGNMDADAFDAALSRMKKLAGAGPLKTVYDPNKRVYKNVPHAVQPAQQPKNAR